MLEPDYYGSIDIRTGKSFLFKPAPGPTDGLWKGNPPTNEEVGHKAGVPLQAEASNNTRDVKGKGENVMQSEIKSYDIKEGRGGIEVLKNKITNSLLNYYCHLSPRL